MDYARKSLSLKNERKTLTRILKMYSIDIEGLDGRKLNFFESESLDEVTHKMMEFQLKNKFFSYSYAFRVNGNPPDDFTWKAFHEKLDKFKKIQYRINSLNKDFV